MTLTIRDEFMSNIQELRERISGMSGPIYWETCMDRRLTKLLAQTYNPERGDVLERNGGGFASKRTVEQAAENGFLNFVELGHVGCAAACLVEDAIKDHKVVPHDVYASMVKPFELNGYNTREQIELHGPKIQEAHIKAVSRFEGLTKQNIVALCIDTPKPLVDHPEVIELVVTTPLGCRYSDLPGIKVEDESRYYIHDDLESARPSIWLAANRVKGLTSIQLIAQNAEERPKMDEFAVTLRSLPYLKNLGIEVKVPKTAGNFKRERPSTDIRERTKV